jgi:hypothetical protein
MRMKYTMNAKELARLAVIKGAIDGAYTVKQVDRRLGVSMRRVKSLEKAVWEHGDADVIFTGTPDGAWPTLRMSVSGKRLSA